MRIFYLLLLIPLAVFAAHGEESPMVIFEIRKDLAYAEASMPKENAGKYLKLYRTGIVLPSSKGKNRRTTQLLLGTVSIVTVEKDYVIVQVPADLVPEVRKGDILEFEPDTGVQHNTTGSVNSAGEAPSKTETLQAANYVFFAGQLAGAPMSNQTLALAEFGYSRNTTGMPFFSGLKPEMVIASLRPMVIRSSGNERTAVAGLFAITFMAERNVIVNTGLQMGLTQTSTVGGGLIGAGIKVPGVLRAEGNVEWLYRVYTDLYGKVAIEMGPQWFFVLQTGLLAMNSQATRTDTLSYSGTTSTYTYDRYKDFAYFTLGFGLNNTRGVRMIARGGLMGENLESIGVLGRFEMGIAF